MTKGQIIEELAKSKFVENYLRKESFEKEDGRIRDYAQEIYVILLSSPDDIIERSYAKGGLQNVKGYAATIIMRQLTFAHSLIWRKYRTNDSRMICDEVESIDMGDPPTIAEFDAMCAEYLTDWERYAVNTYRECAYDRKETAAACGVSPWVVDMVISAIVTKLKKAIQ